MIGPYTLTVSKKSGLYLKQILSNTACTVSRANAVQIRHLHVTSLTTRGDKVKFDVSSEGFRREATTDRPGSKRRILLYPFR